MEETAIGVGAGILITLILLPTRTRDALRDAEVDFLATLDTALDVVGSHLLPNHQPNQPQVQPLAQARSLDRSMQAMRAVAGPLARGWVFATPSDTLHLIRAAMACTYAMRELAQVSRREQQVSDNAAAAVKSTLNAIREEISCLRGALAARKAVPASPEVADNESDHDCEKLRAVRSVRLAVRMMGRSLTRSFPA